MLRIKHLVVSVGSKRIINNFSYIFERGKTYVLMGPNGSGKSTLALTIMGHPSYQIKQGTIYLNKTSLNRLSADQRAKKGIFLSFQSPLSLNGINIFQLLKFALGKKTDPLILKKNLENHAKTLGLKKELIGQSLNNNASGGERKKTEVLQAISLNPKLIIFDEIDTGVDVDGLKTLAQFIKKEQKNKCYIIITHYNRILKHIKPDRVLVINQGRLIKEGDYRLAEEIEKKGYKELNNKLQIINNQ